VADRTAADRPLDLEYRFGKLGCTGRFHLQDEECKAVCGPRPNAGKFLELFNEPAYWLCNVHASEQTGNLHAAGEVSHLAGKRFINLANAFVNSSNDQVLQHLPVSARENFGIHLD